MKNRWYKEGKTLLEEISKSAPPANSIYIWYLGQHGFAINMDNTVLYIDVILNALPGKDGKERRNYPPPFSPNEIQRVAYYICTHNHGDHLNLDTILPLAKANPKTKFIVPRPCASILTNAGIEESRILGANREGIEAGTIKIIPVPAIHTRFIQDEGQKDNNGDYQDLGFVIKAGLFSLYHAGDTWIIPGIVKILKDLGPLNVALLPINGTDWERTDQGCIGNVNAMDAVKLAMAVPIDLVIPSHYDMMPNNTENPAYFADCMYRYCPEKRFHICALGERFIYTL
ncbi:MAG: MBL fold metallo-hydrolase [Treponema sp.]|jgi:L-ascorbate metabolism protein UlaG (beta-lactamase superfamily)|nr:MBL fold metallo-hydrolase [Treponema sp.]